MPCPSDKTLPTHFSRREKCLQSHFCFPILSPLNPRTWDQRKGLYLSKMLLLLGVYKVQEKSQVLFISPGQDTERSSCPCHVPALQLQHSQASPGKILSRRVAKGFLQVLQGLLVPSCWGTPAQTPSPIPWGERHRETSARQGSGSQSTSKGVNYIIPCPKMFSNFS